jgi:hypothetical protein
MSADVRAIAYGGRTAWARSLASPVRDFLSTETGGAVVLLGAAIALTAVQLIPLPQGVLDALAAAFPTTTAARTNFPYAFAVPSAVLREGEMNMGCTEIMSPWGDAVGEGAVG